MLLYPLLWVDQNIFYYVDKSSIFLYIRLGVKEHYRIDIFNPETGFVHVASVQEVPGASRLGVRDQLTRTITFGRIKGKHLPDRDSTEAKEFFLKLREIAGVPQKLQ